MNKFMKMAIEEARKGIDEGHGGPFGCVIVKDGKVLAKAHNEVVLNQDPTCHGEVNAIRMACKKIKSFDLTGCVLYTTGYPCTMCFGAILWANIQKVYYGCNPTDIENIGLRDKEFQENLIVNEVKMCEELDRKECLKLYKKYNDMENKVIY